MELAWMMLANHAEGPPNGLVYISGGAWDVINVTEPLPAGAPPGVVTFVQGVLVVRLEFDPTETGSEYPFVVTIVDEDGGNIGRVDGSIVAPPQPEDHPPTWSIGANMILPLTGLPIPHFGIYRLSVQVNREHKGELPFRAVKRY